MLLKDDLKMRTFIHNYIFGSEEKPVTPMDAVITIVDQNPYIKKCIVPKSQLFCCVKNNLILLTFFIGAW